MTSRPPCGSFATQDWHTATAASGRNVQLETVQKLSREGQTGARPEGEIGFATLRGGGVIGEHSVMIASELEMLTLSHFRIIN